MAQVKTTPNIYVKEIDQSEVTQSAGTSTGAIVMTSVEGPANQRVLTTTDKQVVDIFGIPNPSAIDTGIYAGISFLAESNSLYCVRVTDGTEVYSNLVLSAGSTPLSANTNAAATLTAFSLFISSSEGAAPL